MGHNSWEAAGLTVDDGIALCLHEADGTNLLVDGFNSVLGSRKQRRSRIGNCVAALLQDEIKAKSHSVLLQDYGMYLQCMKDIFLVTK